MRRAKEPLTSAALSRLKLRRVWAGLGACRWKRNCVSTITSPSSTVGSTRWVWIGDYIRRHNDRGYYENRVRLGLQVTYTEEYRRFKFQVRSKAMATFFDERTGEHRVNPRLYWRNRLKVTYQPMNSRFKYALSTELFWLTNDPKKGGLDNLRTVLSVDYRLSRRYYLSAFARMDNDLWVNEPVDRFYFGLTFKAKY